MHSDTSFFQLFFWTTLQHLSTPVSTIPSCYSVLKEELKNWLQVCFEVCRVCVLAHSHTRLHTSDLSMHERNNAPKLSRPICLFSNINTLTHTAVFHHCCDLETEHEHAYLSHTDPKWFNSVYVCERGALPTLLY